MNSRRIFLGLAIIFKLVLAVIICLYFWEATMLVELKQIPVYILVLTVVYIALQLVTRRISSVHHWWDWVYYFGLVSIMVTTMFANHSNENIFHWITDLGTLLLIFPPLADGYAFVKAPKK